MGNQLFQYAAGRAVAMRKGTELKLDVSGFENQGSIITPRQYALQVFNIEENFATVSELDRFQNVSQTKTLGYGQKIWDKLFAAQRLAKFIEPQFCFNPQVFELGAEAYLEGYWQTEKYFSDIIDSIRQEFSLRDEFSIADLEMTKKIQNSNAVSLHIRRGDYVSSATTGKFHGICSLDYYAQAIRHMAEKVATPTFFIFSDDIKWVKENLPIDFPTVYVSDGILKDFEELMLMSHCQHNIIANSSFSWWGAWLNSNPQKIVIAPRQWFADTSLDTKDIVPESWVRM